MAKGWHRRTAREDLEQRLMRVGVMSTADAIAWIVCTDVASPAPLTVSKQFDFDACEVTGPLISGGRSSVLWWAETSQRWELAFPAARALADDLARQEGGGLGCFLVLARINACAKNPIWALRVFAGSVILSFADARAARAARTQASIGPKVTHG